MRWLGLIAVFGLACVAPLPSPTGTVVERQEGAKNETLNAVVRAFVSAAERRDFSTAYEYLSANWRTRYSVKRLEADFESEPLSLFRIQQAARSKNAWVFESETRASKEWGPGKMLQLELEPSGWKVSSLE